MAPVISGQTDAGAGVSRAALLHHCLGRYPITCARPFSIKRGSQGVRSPIDLL